MRSVTLMALAESLLINIWCNQDLQAEVARLTKALAKSERKASKWKARAMDVAKLAAANPHGDISCQNQVI